MRSFAGAAVVVRLESPAGLIYTMVNVEGTAIEATLAMWEVSSEL